MRTNYLMSLRKFFPFLLLLSVLFFGAKNASAQAYAGTIKNYVNTQFSSAFTSIVGQANTNYLGNGSYPYYSYPYYYTYTSLPFNFNYDSTVYTAGTGMYLHDNSAVSFTYTGNWDYGYSISNGYQTQFPNYLNPWGMVYYPYGYSSGIYSQVSGIAPARVWTLEFPNVSCYYSGYAVSIQIKFYETTNVIEYWYSSNNYNMQYGYIGDIGLNGAANGDYTGYNTAYNYFTYQSPFFTPPTQLRYSPKQLSNIQLSVQPKLLSFGSYPAGTPSTPQCINVKNVGTFGTLNVTSATITGASDFQIVSTPASNSYAIGQSGQYCVVFTPSTYGIRNATLNIGSNGQDSGVQTVNLTGIGTVADVTIDSLVRFKRTRTRLGDSLTQYLHITSTGQNPLFMSSFTLSGSDAGQYYVSYYPVNPLLPGHTDSIGITYVPTIEGKHIATLTLISNSFTFPTITVSLQGTGILPHVVITPTLLLFDSTKEGSTVCKTIDIWNPGSDTLKILANVVVSNDGDFHYTGLTGSDTAIAPDEHKTVTICFTPLQQGTRQARLLFRTNIIKTFETPRRDTASTLTVDIHGTGVPFGVFANALSGPPVLDSVAINAQVCRTDTLKNNGDADIMVTGYTFTGGVFSETLLPATPFLLKARTSITFSLCGTPNVEGLITGSLIFAGTTSASNITSTLPLGVFGLNKCVSATPSSLFAGVTLPNNGSDSSQCVMIINCGDIASVYTPTISGANKGDYSFKPAASEMIQKGDTAIFCIDYKPSAVGVSSNTSFNVVSSDGSSATVPLVGADGCAVLTNDVPTIPNTGDNEKRQFTFTISNTNGTFDWTPGKEMINGTGASAFSLISIVPTPITPTTPGLVTMQFQPPLGSAGQTFTANISWPNAGPCGNALSVDLNAQSIQSSVKETASIDGFVLDQTYPNPTQGKANFTYTTPNETEVRITLVDLTGRLIRTLITGRVTQGQHLVNFDASNLPSGTYMYLLESGSTRLVRQLILTK